MLKYIFTFQNNLKMINNLFNKFLKSMVKFMNIWKNNSKTI